MGFIIQMILIISRVHFCHERSKSNFFSSHLSQWLWSTFIQKELEKYMEFRNGVCVRKDKTKAGPSGDSRNNLYFMPDKWGGKNLLQKIDIGIIQELKEEVGGVALLRFVTPEYAAQAEAVYNNLGIQELSVDNIWFVFEQMLGNLSG